MKQYIDIVKKILTHGTWKGNRTDTKTLWFPGFEFRHNMEEGFPLLTTKKMPFKMIKVELEGFIGGITSKKWYQERGCSIWNEWCNPELLQERIAREQPPAAFGIEYVPTELTLKNWQKEEDDLGPIYGYQWRRFNKTYSSTRILGLKYMPSYDAPYDQLATLVKTLQNNSLDRRMIVSAWNPLQIHQMALPPCHYEFQCMSDGKYLDLTWRQRSVDVGLGLPFNIASYGLLLQLLAVNSNLTPRYLIGSLGDTHIYENQIENIKLQIDRKPRELPQYNMVSLSNLTIFDWEYDWGILENYHPHPRLNLGEVAV